VTFVAYFFYYYDGNVYGPRYYYEISFFLVPLFARGIILSNNKLSKISTIKHLQPKVIVYAFIFAGFIFHYTAIVPNLFGLHLNAFWGMDPALSKLVEKKNIKHSLIFIYPHRFYSSGAGAMNLFDIDSNENIYALDLGDSSNANLINYYKDRKVYRAVFNKEWFEKMPFELHEIKIPEPSKKIVVEMENKSYPVEGVPDYCNTFPFWPHADPYSGFFLPQEMLTNTYFFCRFRSKDQFYTLGQYFKEAGNYKMTIKAVNGPVDGKFSIITGNQKRTVDFHSDRYHYKDIEIHFNFTEGLNYIKFIPIDIKKDGSYFIIDKLEFELEVK